MRGHTRIELHDAKTGELVQAVEDSNMITNALNEIFKPVFGVSLPMLRMLLSNGGQGYFDQLNNNLIGMLTQGLLLFDKALDEDPDLIYKPSGVNNVGAGIDIAYTGVNPFFGSFNVLESQVDYTLGYVKYVWDFNSSQANGTIACACLTTKQGARCTAGIGAYDSNVIGQWLNNTGVLDLMGNNYTGYGMSWKLGQLGGITPGALGKSWLYGSYDDNYVLQLNNPDIFDYIPSITGSIFQAQSIKIDKYRIPFSQVSVFDYRSPRPVAGKYIEKLIDTYTLDMPQAIKDLISSSKLTSSFYYPNSILKDKDHVYFSFFNPVSAGGGNNNLGAYAPNDDMLFWDIDLLNITSSVKTVKNTTGETIQAYGNNAYSQRNDGYPIYVLKDYTVVITTTNHIYIINNTDNTEVRKVIMNGQELIFSYNYGFREGFERKGIFIFTLGLTSSSGDGPIYSLDLETAVCSYLNVKHSNLYYLNANFQLDRRLNYLEGFAGACANERESSGTSLCQGIFPYFDPSLLMTINNLPEPVVKTSALTMKVTYTLTDGVTA